MGYGEGFLYTNDAELPVLVRRLIAADREATHWDFKRIWHANNADLVHDIICLANNPKGFVGMLIVGVDDGFGHKLFDVEEHSKKRKNTQNVINLLRARHWMTTFPCVRVVPIELDGTYVDVLLIEPDDEAVPYILTDDYTVTVKNAKTGEDQTKTVRCGTIYTRDGDGNTPINGTASAVVAERLWRRHFGLDKTPLQRATALLANPAAWKDTKNTIEGDDEGFQSCYYHEDFPEFTYIRKFIEEDDRQDHYEYFMLASPFFRDPQWCVSRIYYHQTLLFETLGAFSDHLYIPSPKFGYIYRDARSFAVEDVLMYGYFIEGSIEKRLLEFMLDESKEGPLAEETENMLFKLLPLFRGEEERARFEYWVERQWPEAVKRIEKHEERLLPNDIPSNIAKTLKRRERVSKVIVEMLEEFRAENAESTGL